MKFEDMTDKEKIGFYQLMKEYYFRNYSNRDKEWLENRYGKLKKTRSSFLFWFSTEISKMAMDAEIAAYMDALITKYEVVPKLEKIVDQLVEKRNHPVRLDAIMDKLCTEADNVNRFRLDRLHFSDNRTWWIMRNGEMSGERGGTVEEAALSLLASFEKYGPPKNRNSGNADCEEIIDRIRSCHGKNVLMKREDHPGIDDAWKIWIEGGDPNTVVRCTNLMDWLDHMDQYLWKVRETRERERDGKPT